MQAGAAPTPVREEGEFWINAAGRKIPKVIPGYGPTKPYRGAFAVLPKTEGIPAPRAPEHHAPRNGASKEIKSLEEALRICGAHDGMTISFHHHLRGGDGVLVPTIMTLRKMGIRGINLAPSSLHDGQKQLIECFKDGTVTNIQTGANDSLGLSVTAGDLKGMMVVRSHGARVRAIREGDINIDIAVIAASEADNQGNCNGIHGKSACGPLAYSAADAKYAKHVIVVTDNLVEYPCTPMSINETNVDYVVVVPTIGDPKKITSGTTRLTSDPQQLLIGEYCARLIDALGLITPDLQFQAGSGGTSLTSMAALSARLKAKGISAKMANGGTTCILIDMLKKGLVRKLTTCQSFDLASVKSLAEDWPRHVETDIDQYANPSNCGSVVNQLDVMVAGATEVDVHFNVDVNTHSDGSFQHNTGGHQDTAAGAKLTIVTMPVARRANPGVVDNVTTITTPGECIGAVVTEEGVAINPLRTDLLEKLRGKTEAELGFKLMTIEQLRDRGIEKAGRRHTIPRTQERIIGVIEWRDGTVLDVVRQPLPRKDLGDHARVAIKKDQPANAVEVDCVDPNPFIKPEETKKMAEDMLAHYHITGCAIKITYDFALPWAVAAKIECELRRAYPALVAPSDGFNIFPQKACPAPQHDRPLRRSHLYIPGNDPNKMGKAGSTHADGVILDIEDAVDHAVKDYARVLVRHALRGGVDFGTAERMMRINGVNELGFLDLEVILPHATIDTIVVPKVETAAEIHRLEAKICEILHVERSPVLLLPLIESALGVENAFEIVRASPNLVAISMGLEDYTQDRGVERTETDEESQWALQRVANAACVAGLQMVDVVYSQFDDVAGLEAHIARAKKCGFFGKRCIHPNQVPHINRLFSPEKPDIDESTAAVTTFLKAPAGTGVVKITSKKGKSKMVDKPVLLRAVHCLKLALACEVIPVEQRETLTRQIAEVMARVA